MLTLLDRKYCSYVLKELGAGGEKDGGKRRSMTICGADKSVVKAVSVVEMVKRESKVTLYQSTVLGKTKEGKPKLTMILSVDDLEDKAGYQVAKKG